MNEKDGLVDRGFELMCGLIALAPSPEHFQGVKAWLEPPVIRALGIDRLRLVVVTLAEYAQGLPTPCDPATEEFMNLRVSAQILSAIRAQFAAVPQVYAAEVVVRRRLGEPAAVLRLAEEAAARFPSDWACLAVLGSALRDARQPDEALKCAERALELNPSDGSPLYDAAGAFMDVGRAADAARVLTELLQRFPDYPEAAEALTSARARLAPP